MGTRNDCMYISGLLVSSLLALAMMECACSGSL